MSMDSDEIKRLLSSLKQMSEELTHLEKTYSVAAITDRSARLQILAHLQYIVSLAGLTGMHITESLKAEETKA